MTRKDLPNIISLLRVFLTIPVIWALLEKQFLLALVLFFIAGISDALDGFLAKHFHWQSKLGEVLDPLADKVLLISAFLCLGALSLIPTWLVAMVILRDLFIVSIVLIYTYQVEPFRALPSLISKFNTLLQIILVLVVMLDQDLFLMPDGLIAGVIYLVAVTTLLSGLGYLLKWRAMLKNL